MNCIWSNIRPGIKRPYFSPSCIFNVPSGLLETMCRYPPQLFKSSLYEKPTLLCTCFCWPIEIWRGFSFWLNKWIAKIAIGLCFAVCHSGAGYPQVQSPHGDPPWKPCSAFQHQATRVMNYACEHVCFTSSCCVHPLAKCVLRHQKSLTVHKGAVLSIKLDIINLFNHREQNKDTVHALD